MHLNLTLSAPGGPGSSWGDHENPKPLGAGGREALPPVSSRRFAAAFRGPRRESPLGRWSQHFWKLLEWGRCEAGPCCPGVDSKAVSGLRQPGLWPDFFTGSLGTRSRRGVKCFGLEAGHRSGSALSPLHLWPSLSGSPKYKRVAEQQNTNALDEEKLL